MGSAHFLGFWGSSGPSQSTSNTSVSLDPISFSMIPGIAGGVSKLLFSFGEMNFDASADPTSSEFLRVGAIEDGLVADSIVSLGRFTKLTKRDRDKKSARFEVSTTSAQVGNMTSVHLQAPFVWSPSFFPCRSHANAICMSTLYTTISDNGGVHCGPRYPIRFGLLVSL